MSKRYKNKLDYYDLIAEFNIFGMGSVLEGEGLRLRPFRLHDLVANQVFGVGLQNGAK